MSAADGSCNNGASDDFQTLTGRLIGFNIRRTEGYGSEDAIRSAAPIVDSSSCELAEFSPLPASNPIIDMTYVVGQSEEKQTISITYLTAWGENCGFSIALSPVYSHIYLDSGEIKVYSTDPTHAANY